MVWRWGAAAVLVGVLAGCSSSAGGDGAPAAGPASTVQGLPVPAERTNAAPSTTTPPPPTTAAPSTTAAPPTTRPAPTTGPAGRPCPADVVRTLPGARPATLVAGFGTTRFRVYFCRTDRGRLYYRGISRANPKQATTIAARTISGGYEASTVFQGDAFVYRVSQGRLLVTKNGTLLFTDPVTSTL